MGFVGTPIVRRLAVSHRVTVVDRLDFGMPQEMKRLLQDKIIDLRQKDICQDQELIQMIGSGAFDLVIHLAALHYIPACERNPISAYQNNLLSSLAILQNCPAGARMINFSTSAVYKTEERPHREEESPLKPCDIYGWTKKHVEDLAIYYADKKNLSILNIRLFNATGPGETNPHVLPAILSQLQKGAVKIELGNLDPQRDFIDIEDIAWAIEKLIQRWPVKEGRLENYNLGSGSPLAIGDLFVKIIHHLGREISLKSVSERCRSNDRKLLCADLTKLKSVLPDFNPKKCDQWISALVHQPALRIDAEQANRQ